MRAVIVTVLILAGNSLAFGQGLATLQPGERVRILIPEEAAQAETPVMHRFSIRGNVSRVVSDTLFVRIPGTMGDLSIPRSSIREVFRSRGVPSRPVSGFRRAIGIGLLTGIYTGLTYGQVSDWGASDRTDAAMRGAAFGAIVGFMHGFLMPTERWKRVRL